MKRSNGWNQEVTDAQGRRRFHGAFTGGFSAGHYNTVGSEDGWAPSTFVSSRESRANVAPRRAEDFMDEEDDPLLGKRLETSEAFDTLHQNEKARRLEAAEKSVGARPIFQVPDELILPASGDSIGKKLLSRMGWKDGHGIGPRMRKRKLSIGSDEEETKHENEDDVGKQEVYVPPRSSVDVRSFPKPKTDKYGAGFDPYVDAPEFLQHKLKQQQDGEQSKPQRQVITFAQALGDRKPGSKSTSSRAAMGFGLSALEENDDLDVYDTTSMDDFDRAIAPAGESIQLLDSMTSSARDKKRREAYDAVTIFCSDGRPALEGFRIASKKETPPRNVIERLEVPSDIRAYHVFDENDQVVSVQSVYKKYNFSTEKGGRGSTITAKQRAQMLHGEDKPTSNESTTEGTTASTGSVFDMIDPAQREKLMGAAQAARERKPLTQAAPTAQFRANIMASISKRFVSASTTSDGPTDATGEGVTTSHVVEKKSHRTEDAWAPHVLLCKRFRVKCEGLTISGGAQDGDDGPQDLFTTELAPHLIDLAASRRSIANASASSASNPSQAKPPVRDEADELPPLPVAAKPSTDLLRSIFEPSDESDIEEDDDEEVDDSGEGAEENRPVDRTDPLPTSAARTDLTATGAGALPPIRNIGDTVATASLLTDESSASEEDSGDSSDDDRHARKRKSKSKKHTKRRRKSDDYSDEERRSKHKKSVKKHKKKHKHKKSSDRESSRSSRHGRSRSRERSRSRSRTRSRQRMD